MHHNLQFKRENPIELFFHEYFRAVDKESEGQYMTTTAIFEYLKSKMGSGLQIGNLFYFGRMLRNVPRMRHRKGEYGTEYLVALLK